jgi:hypothetical protein
LRKILTRLRVTNFCTISARLAPNFITQPNGPQCTKIVRNAPKYEFRVEWNGSGAFVAKNFVRGPNFCTSSACFTPSFVRQPSGPKCTKNVQNAAKYEFRVQWGGLGALVAKNSDATSWHELLHQFGTFCTDFRKSTKWSKMHQNCMNAPKLEFRVKWGGSGAFIMKNCGATSWHELLHQFGPFCIKFRRSTKRSQMHQN